MSLNGFSFLLAQVATSQETGRNPQGDMVRMILMIGVFGVMMWLLMIRPQQKRAREQETMIKAIKPGDKIVTTSGIIGVVLSIKDRSLSIRSGDTKLEILKSAVSEVTERSGESSES